MIVKAGENGCLLALTGAEQEAIPVNPLVMVDASGAGDAFNAGYLSARIEGFDPLAAATRGQILVGWAIIDTGRLPLSMMSRARY